ncbi:hypothetical protein NPX13_g9710 [Xylaria arbuscula]|uniref:Uncharacterized protein n=1 Tax=Xylaria arbuscula TaxID=114810 RepID=A0A9W8THG0_9PEZI|nr:hypothetical protein NPX13_g9710 [Xylaria arbuscula]
MGLVLVTTPNRAVIESSQVWCVDIGQWNTLPSNNKLQRRRCHMYRSTGLIMGIAALLPTLAPGRLVIVLGPFLPSSRAVGVTAVYLAIALLWMKYLRHDCLQLLHSVIASDQEDRANTFPMAPDYYHLNGPGHQGPRRNESQHRPQGPAPGPPPRVNPQGQPQGQPPMPPPPPRNILPVDLRGGPPVQIVDITQELPMSQSDMQEELTDYIVFQYEKVADKDALDDYGQPKWPSWEKAIRVEDRSISKRTAADKVRQLNQTTKGIIDKKNSLTPALKRQIDSTLEYLMKREPDPINFHWYLAQIDHQLRRIKSYHPVESNPHYVSIPTGKHRSANAFLFPTKKRSRSRGRSGNHHSKKKKKAYERISLTAYFKRVPRQGVNVAQLWHEKRMYQAQQGQNVFPQMQPNQAPFQGPQHQAQPGPPPNRRRPETAGPKAQGNAAKRF